MLSEKGGAANAEKLGAPEKPVDPAKVPAPTPGQLLAQSMIVLETSTKVLDRLADIMQRDLNQAQSISTKLDGFTSEFQDRFMTLTGEVSNLRKVLEARAPAAGSSSAPGAGSSDTKPPAKAGPGAQSSLGVPTSEPMFVGDLESLEWKESKTKEPVRPMEAGWCFINDREGYPIGLARSLADKIEARPDKKMLVNNGAAVFELKVSGNGKYLNRAVVKK